MRLLSHISLRLVSLTSSESSSSKQTMASYPSPVVVEAERGKHTATVSKWFYSTLEKFSLCSLDIVRSFSVTVWATLDMDGHPRSVKSNLPM